VNIVAGVDKKNAAEKQMPKSSKIRMIDKTEGRVTKDSVQRCAETMNKWEKSNTDRVNYVKKNAREK